MRLRLYRTALARRKRVDRVLDFVSIEDQPKLVVDPLAAMGTDIIGLGLATTVALAPLPWPIRVLGALGGAWMGVALATEASKLRQRPTPLVRQQRAVAAYPLRLRLSRRKK